MERESWMNWNPRFNDPDENTLIKMKQSIEAYENAPKREILCPVCHRKLVGVHAERIGFVDLKCQNCKFTGVLDLRLFRTHRHVCQNSMHYDYCKNYIR